MLSSSSKRSSLREVVYDYLREKMNGGELLPGAFFNLREISEALGISTTPLREALVQLETEGFITIFHRRGAMANALTPKIIKDIYMIIGALEAAALMEASPRISPSVVKRMKQRTGEMARCIRKVDMDGYFQGNTGFHDAYIDLADNRELSHQIRIFRQRLYDFPRNDKLVLPWEKESLKEHEEIVSLLEKKDFPGAAAYLREVHWNYHVQERFIQQYYTNSMEALESRRG